MKNKIYDVIGIGFGPANIAIAIAMEELAFEKNTIFFEAKANVSWQENMMFEDSDIQNNPLRDLATPRNPRSKYSFTNFLFEKKRLYEHLNSGFSYPLRVEFAQYIKWVGDQFKEKVQFNTKIESIKLVKYENQTDIYELIDSLGNIYYSYSIILAPGRTPNIPKEFEKVNSDNVIFLNNYLKKVDSIECPKRIAVIGGSQSSIEIILNLSEKFPDSTILGISRSFGYKQKDVNPFTGEVYFPEFVDLFYNSPDETKKSLIQDLHLTNYSASDADVLDRLYKKIYLQKITDKQKIYIHRKASISKVDATKENEIKLFLNKVEAISEVIEEVDLVVLATGFKNLGAGENDEKYPAIMENIIDEIIIDKDDYLRINYDYSINMKNIKHNTFFLNGLCESSHGMGDAGSFSLLALRSEVIIKSLIENFKLIEKQTKICTTTLLN
jgi:L-ornithine N5-oxygenase